MKKAIDINADMGESFGRYTLVDDGAIMPYISSVNVACGYHAGDALQIDQTIEKAKQYGLRVGAHPSYPDLQGFGRRYIQLSKAELTSMIRYQVSAVKGLCEAHGITLSYIKPHGALYNRMAGDEKEATTVIEAIQSISVDLPILCMASSVAESVAKSFGHPFIAEAFIDRRYVSQSQLMSRSQAAAVITQPEEAYEQLYTMITQRYIRLSNGETAQIQAESYCIHGDNPMAIEILQYIQNKMKDDSIVLKLL